MLKYETEALQNHNFENSRKRIQYEPGEQKKMNYDLPFDKDNFRFGEKSKQSNASVQQCLNSYEKELEIKTQLTDKQVEEIRFRHNQPPFVSLTNKFHYKNRSRA